MKTLIKTFVFSADERAGCTFSDPTMIYIDGASNSAKLRADAAGAFPTTDGLWVASATTTPLAARQLLKAQAFIRHVRVADDNVTSDGYRLHDGASHYFWNGAAWTIVAPSSSSWNTEAELNAGLPSFQLGAVGRTFGVVAKLGTTSTTATPELFEFKVAYSARVVSFIEDIVERSLVADVEAKVRPVASFVYQMAAAGAAVNVGAMVDQDDSNFTVVGLDGVFDHGADPDCTTDLLASYDPGTRQAVLAASVPQGTILQVEIVYAPKVGVQTFDPDFIEVAKVPGLFFTNVREQQASPSGVDDSVVNKSDGTAIVVPAPYRSNLAITVMIMAGSGKELRRLAEELKGYAETNPVLKSTAIDEGYRFFLRDEFSDISAPSQAGVRVAQATFTLMNVAAWTRPARSEAAVRAIQFGGDVTSASGSGQPPVGDGV
jgi:hypothetical protein